MTSRLGRGALLLAFTIGYCFSGSVGAQAELDTAVDIPAGPLGSSLLTLSEVYRIQILAPNSLVQGKRAAALRGRSSLADALTTMLAGTQLVAKELPNGAYTIEALPDPAPTPVRSLPPAQDPPPTPRLETLIVTGEKLERSLQETTSSVSVLTGAVIDESYLTDAEQILLRIPNVSTNGADGLVIRGIPERGLGTGVGDTSQTSAFYIDGAVQSLGGGQTGLLSTWDVAQFEVFRGPQTTTQGRAALGGAVVVQTEDPGFEWSGRARVATGEFGTRQYAAAMGGPIVDGLLAFRVATDLTETDGYISVLTENGEIDEIARDDRDLYRGKLLFTPLDGLAATFTLSTAQAEEAPNAINTPPPVSERRTLDAVNLTDTDITSYVFDVDYEISQKMSLTSVTAYTDRESTTAPIEQTLAVGGFPTDINSQDQQFTQELRLSFDTSNVRGLIGAYYSKLDEEQQRVGSGLVAPDVVLFLEDSFANSFENFALFTDMEINLSPRWTVLAGARYDVEDSTRSESQNIFTDPPVDFLPPVEVSFPPSDATFSAFLPKLGLRHDFTDRIGLTATVQRAYRPGGADIRPDTGEAVEFAPEFTTNYEVAFRGLFLNDTLSVNVNAFFVDYSDMQIRFAPDPANPLLRFVANAGEAELFGVEVETLWDITDSLSLYGSLGFIDSELGVFEFQGENLQGNEFPQQAAASGALGGTWRHPSGFMATVDTAYTGSYFSALQNDPQGRTDSRFVTNARVGYKADHYGVFIFAQNVFDAQYLLSTGPNAIQPGATFGTVGQPRTLGVILEAQF